MKHHNTNSSIAKYDNNQLFRALERKATKSKDNGSHVGVNESALASAVLELLERIEDGSLEVEIE